MNRRTRQYLKFQNWPAADKKLWKATFTPGTDLFDDGGGPGAHLAERTISQLECTYGKFLYFVSVSRADLLNRNPAERIDSEVIEEFVNWQPTSCGAITLSIYLYHLWLAMKYLCPRGEWQWLLAVSTRIKARGKAKPERHHLVTSDRLYRLGACPSNRCSNPSESDSSLDYEQALSPLEYRSDAASAAECAGLRAEGPRLAVYR